MRQEWHSANSGMRRNRGLVEGDLSRGARLNEELAVDIGKCAITGRVLAICSCVSSNLRNILSRDGVVVVDQVCARGQSSYHFKDWTGVANAMTLS